MSWNANWSLNITLLNDQETTQRQSGASPQPLTSRPSAYIFHCLHLSAFEHRIRICKYWLYQVYGWPRPGPRLVTFTSSLRLSPLSNAEIQLWPWQYWPFASSAATKSGKHTSFHCGQRADWRPNRELRLPDDVCLLILPLTFSPKPTDALFLSQS